MPVKSISFGMGNGDLEAQQMELQRRQKIVDMLRQQGTQPRETQQVSGIAVRQSPLETLSQLAQIGVSTYQQGKIDKQQQELSQERSARQAQALRDLAPSGVFDQQPDNSGVVDGMMGSQVDPDTRNRWAKILSAQQFDPALSRKLLEDELTRTDEQRNMAAQGIDPRQFGQARLAKEQAGGLVNVAPGTSVLNAGTGKFQAVAPDFGTGIQGSYGPNGPQVSRMAGAENITNMQGERARAEAAGRAGFNTITVNTPNGPVLMTEEQAAQMAGGGRQNNATAPVNFTASNGVSINLAGKSPQQIIQAAQASGDPQVMQAVGEWMNSGQQQAGIPLQSEAQRELQVGQAKNAVELAKDLAKNAQSPEAQQKISDAQSVVDLLGEASPYIKNATGSSAGSLRDSALGIVGQSTAAGRDAARLAAIGGQLVSKMPKMSGPQSDKDVQLYKEMAGRIGDPSVPSDIKAAAADTIMRLNRKYLEKNQGSMAAEALKATKQGGSPSLEDLMKKYGGTR